MSESLTVLAVQHNKLVEARYNLTLQEKRIILWLVSQIQPQDEEFKTYRVSIKQLAALIGVQKNKNLYTQMAEITGQLRSRPIDIIEENGEILLQSTWINLAKYHYGHGYVDLSFSNHLKPYLLQLKTNFTKLQLAVALSLSSGYAVRIYELLKQYEKIGFRVISLAKLREYLGIDATEYQKYSNFKNRILEIAQREINRKTDIRFEYTEIKEIRKITEIRFDVYPNNPVRLKLSHLSEPQSTEPANAAPDIEIPKEIQNKLRYFGIARYKVIQMVYAYGLNVIQAKLQDFETAIDAGKSIKNPAGWLLSAIEKDWNYKSPYQIEQEHQEQAEQERLEQEYIKSAEKAKKELELRHYKLAFDSHIRALFWPRWNALSQEQQEQLATQVISNPIEQGSYNKKGAESPVVLAKLLPHVLSLEELDFESWYASRSL